ncbi:MULTISPECIES: hypothetical protein [Okeania]|nr:MULTISPECIES: hypothetical protein [Okeania]
MGKYLAMAEDRTFFGVAEYMYDFTGVRSQELGVSSIEKERVGIA